MSSSKTRRNRVNKDLHKPCPQLIAPFSLGEPHKHQLQGEQELEKNSYQKYDQSRNTKFTSDDTLSLGTGHMVEQLQDIGVI
jgi:hypothetical protein